MASLGNPRTWVPYMNNKDCSQGFCSLYCPQWCYIVYPPPPPPTFEFPQDHNDSTPNFSPLVIAIIGILLSAFLLVSYYTFISKYCGRNTQSSSSSPPHNHDEIQDNDNPLLHEPWHVSTNGLDEALIKSIRVCKYKKEDGLVGGVTDCSVCLSEFEEDESLRLLPKCSHAFHLPCIDQWLKSHSNCPLCRALIFTFNSSSSTIQVPPPPPVIEQEAPTVEIQNNEREENVRREGEMIGGVEESAKPGLRAFSDLGFMQGRHRMIEIRDELDDDEVIRRSVSMDHSLQIGEMEECCNEAGPSKTCGGGGEESSKCSNRRKVLPCVWSPMAMKRSFSSGRFSIGRSGRGRQGIIPL